MNRTLIASLPHHVDEVVTIKGWVQVVRNQKRMQFLVIRDITGDVQVVNERGNAWDDIIFQLSPQSTVEIVGHVVSNPQVKLNQIEVVLKTLAVTSFAATPLPIGEDTNLDQRLDWRYLDLRRPENRLLFQVQTTAENAMRRYWTERDFIEIHSPKLMGSPSESGAELFKVEYFDRTAYLAQSPQFYKQMAMASGLDKVFEIGPVFRADPSFTSRHATEFTGVDVEISWIESHEDVMTFEEQWLQYVLQVVSDCHGAQIKQTFGTEVVVPTLPFPRIALAEAKRIISKEYGHKLSEGADLDPEGERRISEYVKKVHGHEFVYITDYPVSIRAFYHMRYEHNPSLTKSFDLLWKGVEITTGAQREHRYDRLLQQTIEKGLNPAVIQFYLDFFKYGCPPHGGFGFGLARMIMLLLGLKNIREVSFLFRGPNRLEP